MSEHAEAIKRIALTDGKVMQLVIMRHGQAESKASSDALRNLTDKGRQDVKAMAERLGECIKPLTHLVYSPYNRTSQSAQIVAEHFSQIGLKPDDTNVCVDSYADVYADEAIAADVTLSSALNWLESLINSVAENSGSLMLVSHQPLVSQLVAWLVHGAEGQALTHYPEVAMSPGSVALLELEVIAKGAAQLDAMFHTG